MYLLVKVNQNLSLFLNETSCYLLAATPNFLKEPAVSQSALKDGQVIFECQIGASQPSYHWLKDGRNISKGSISLMGSLSTLSVGNLEFSDSGNYSCIATDKQSGQSGEKTGILTVKGTFSFLRGTIYLVCRTLLGHKIARLSFWARGKRSCSCFSKFYMAGSSLLAS